MATPQSPARCERLPWCPPLPCFPAETPWPGGEVRPDRAGVVFGYPGLFVSDGAAIPTSLAVNTSLTILANAERVAAAILERHGLTHAKLVV